MVKVRGSCAADGIWYGDGNTNDFLILSLLSTVVDTPGITEAADIVELASPLAIFRYIHVALWFMRIHRVFNGLATGKTISRQWRHVAV